MDSSYLKYLKYKNKYLKLKMELNNQSGGKCMNDRYNSYDLSKQMGGSGDDEIMLFKAEWCGHCQNFKNDWEALQVDEDLKSKYIFNTFDSDKDKNKMEEYKIKGYPTLYVRKNNKTVEYTGGMDRLQIKYFINHL